MVIPHLLLKVDVKNVFIVNDLSSYLENLPVHTLLMASQGQSEVKGEAC